MKNFTDFLNEDCLFEAADAKKKGRHLQHLEDLVFTGGDQGVEHAANILDDMNTMLSGKKKASFNSTKAKSFVAGKFDGAPAIIFGHDPKTKKFFVASKSAFNATPKVNYTMADIEKNHGDSPGLADKLREALQYLPSVAPKKGVYQGDFMYDRWSIKKSEKYHEWTPNTITYRVKANSHEGRRAMRAKFGIVIHTKYEGKTLADLKPTPFVDHENFGENPEVHLIPATVDMNPENWKPKDRSDFENELENAKIKYRSMKPEALDQVVKHADLLDRYINQAVRGKTKPDVEEYIKFLARTASVEANSFKTPKKQEETRRKYNELAKEVMTYKKSFQGAFELHGRIQKAKDILMSGVRQNTPDYEYYINGKKTGPEGYVVYRDGQDAIKLVNRKEFSKMNFELAKMKKSNFPVPAVPPAIVMAFGRMNPPTGGHEEVINKVKEVANQYNADHEIVLSGTNEPDKNPLTPDQKVKYAKKFFPGINITAATKDAPDFLTHAARMYAAGHKDLIMVAGPDRAESFRKILANYNGKQGKHGYFKFDHIKVVESNRIAGKSGTEMRGYAEKGDYDSFRKGLPSTSADADQRSLYRDVKRAQQHKPALREESEKTPADSKKTWADMTRAELEAKLAADPMLVKSKEPLKGVTILGAKPWKKKLAEGMKYRIVKDEKGGTRLYQIYNGSVGELEPKDAEKKLESGYYDKDFKLIKRETPPSADSNWTPAWARKKALKEELNELKYAHQYTVAPADLKSGQDLEAMTTRMGRKEGRAAFKKKWPYSNVGVPPVSYSDYVHATPSISHAKEISGDLKGAAHKKMTLYDIRPGKKMNKFRMYGGSHFDAPEQSKVKDRIPARYIRNRLNPDTKKWEPFNRQYPMSKAPKTVKPILKDFGQTVSEAISRRFLHKFKNQGREFSKTLNCEPYGTSAGACATASYAVHKKLQKQGKDSHFVVGHYDEKGIGPEKKYGRKINGGDVNHAWLVSGNKIIDVTHNQFGPMQSVRAGLPSGIPVGTAIVKTQHNDPRYSEFKRDKHAERHIHNNWPLEQNLNKSNMRRFDLKEVKMIPGGYPTGTSYKDWTDDLPSDELVLQRMGPAGRAHYKKRMAEARAARLKHQNKNNIKESKWPVDQLHPNFKARLVPALKHNKTGEMIIGKRGEEHLDAFRRHFPKEINPVNHNLDTDYNAGFYDPKKKTYYNSHFVHGVFLDTPDLMTKTQRIRRYGDFTEEEVTEC